MLLQIGKLLQQLWPLGWSWKWCTSLLGQAVTFQGNIFQFFFLFIATETKKNTYSTQLSFKMVEQLKSEEQT